MVNYHRHKFVPARFLPLCLTISNLKPDTIFYRTFFPKVSGTISNAGSAKMHSAAHPTIGFVSKLFSANSTTYVLTKLGICAKTIPIAIALPLTSASNISTPKLARIENWKLKLPLIRIETIRVSIHFSPSKYGIKLCKTY
jgi:hypothetical protein